MPIPLKSPPFPRNRCRPLRVIYTPSFTMLYQDFDVRGAFQRFTNLSADVYRGAYTPSKFRTLHERLTLLLYLYLSIWSGKIFIILIREELKASKVKFSQRFLSTAVSNSRAEISLNINTRKTFGNECARYAQRKRLNVSEREREHVRTCPGRK